MNPLKTIKNVIYAIIIIAVLAIVVWLYLKLKDYSRHINTIQQKYQVALYEGEKVKAELRSLDMAAGELRSLLGTKDELIGDYRREQKELLQKITDKDNRIKQLEQAIGISATASHDTVFLSQTDTLHRCSVKYDDGYLNLDVAVDDSVNLKYTYNVKGSIGIYRTKYKKDGSEIRHPAFYFWKRWDSKVVAKIEGKNVNYEQLQYIRLDR